MAGVAALCLVYLICFLLYRRRKQPARRKAQVYAPGEDRNWSLDSQKDDFASSTALHNMPGLQYDHSSVDKAPTSSISPSARLSSIGLGSSNSYSLSPPPKAHSPGGSASSQPNIHIEMSDFYPTGSRMSSPQLDLIQQLVADGTPIDEVWSVIRRMSAGAGAGTVSSPVASMTSVLEGGRH